MDILIGIIIIFCVCFLPGIITDHKFNTRIPPQGSQVDWGAMNNDLTSGKSKTEVKQKFNRGGYDVPDPWVKK